MNRLSATKEEKSGTNSFHMKHALKIIVQQLQICKKKRTAEISPPEAHFVRKPITPLSVTCTTSKLSKLLYENIMKYYSDEDTIPPEVIFPDDKQVNGYRSDISIEEGIMRATRDTNEREKNSTNG